MATVKTKKRKARDVYAEFRAKSAETMLERLNAVLQTPLAEDEKTFDHVTPSGMTWKLRKPNVPLFLKAGLLPTALAMKMALLAQEGRQGQEMLKQVSSKELAQTIEFNSSVVRYICIDPRIVETPVNDDEIAFDDVVSIDYDDLLKWANERGEEAAKLNTFRKE